MAKPTMTMQLDPLASAGAVGYVRLVASNDDETTTIAIATASGVAVAGERVAKAGRARTVSVTTTNASVTVTGVLKSSDLGKPITGSGIPADTHIASVGASTFTLSNAATASGTITATVDTDGLLTFPQLNPNAGRSVSDAVTVSGDATLTSATMAFTADDVGHTITGTGIPTGTTIASRNSATSVELSATATASATGVTITVPSDDVIDDPSGTVWEIVTKYPGAATPAPVYFTAPDLDGYYQIVAPYVTTRPSDLSPPGATNAGMDGDVGGIVGDNTINPLAVTTPKVADQNVTPPKLVAEDENGRAFRIDFSTYADADVLPAPFLDAVDIGLEAHNDRLGIRDGGLTELEFTDANYPGPPLSSGWRGLAYLDLPWSDGFEAKAMVDNTTPEAGGGPMVCFVEDDTDNAVGSYIVPPLSWFELGPIGREALDFRYLDTCPSDLVLDDPENVEVIIRVLHGWVWLLIDGVRRCGPVELPAGLVGSRRHGVQTDYAVDESLPSVKWVEFSRYDGPVALDYPPAVITAGATATKGTAATSRDIPIPDGLVIGDWLGLWFAASATITTPTGWTLDSSTATAGSFRLRYYTHKVDGTEAWYGLTGQTLTVAHGSSISAGHIVKLADANPYRPCTVTLASDATSDTTATIPTQVAWGPHRSSMICVAVPTERTVTWSTGWTGLAATGAGGAAITLAIATVADWSDPPAPLALSETYVFGGRETGAQTATLSSASTCLTGHVMVGPDQEGAPS